MYLNLVNNSVVLKKSFEARSSTGLGCLSGQRAAGDGGWLLETYAGMNGRALKYLQRSFDADWNKLVLELKNRTKDLDYKKRTRAVLRPGKAAQLGDWP